MAKRTTEEEIAFLEGKIEALKNQSTKNRVLVSVVLDESGSMASCKGATIDGFNEYIDTLIKDQTTDYRITLTKFDSFGNRVLWENERVTSDIRLTNANFSPNGGTPLYDALGDALAQTKRVVAKGTNVVFLVLTDGGENASGRYKSADIQKTITDRTKQDDWTFMYIGANQDAWSVGNSLGIVNAYNFNTNHSRANFDSLADMTITASAMYASGASPTHRNAVIREVRSDTYRETKDSLDTNTATVV